jgi:hypothetical protein
MKKRENGGENSTIIYRRCGEDIQSRSRTTDSGQWGGRGRELVDVAIVDNNPRRPGCTNGKEKIQEKDETQ